MTQDNGTNARIGNDAAAHADGQLVYGEDMESLWSRAEHLGRVHIDWSINGGYKASILLDNGGDTVCSNTNMPARDALRQALDKAHRLLGS